MSTIPPRMVTSPEEGNIYHYIDIISIPLVCVSRTVCMNIALCEIYIVVLLDRHSHNGF